MFSPDSIFLEVTYHWITPALFYGGLAILLIGVVRKFLLKKPALYHLKLGLAAVLLSGVLWLGLNLLTPGICDFGCDNQVNQEIPPGPSIE